MSKVEIKIDDVVWKLDTEAPSNVALVSENGIIPFVLKKKHEVGDSFELLGLRWKILDIVDGTYKCLAEKLEEKIQFDSNSNNWATSGLREYLNGEFYNKLKATVGEDNIVLMERDLLSLDGQTEYGKCEDKISLLTVDEYRKYRPLIPNTDEYWWWLITPWSTPCNDYHSTLAVVSSSGDFNGGSYYGYYGVRPFVSFSSAIFESEE